MTTEPMQDADKAPHTGQPAGEKPDAGQGPADPSPEAGAEPALADRLEALQGELEQLRAESLRERADLDNQRKRLAREIEQARRFANERLLSELLPLFDSMEAGLAAAAQNDPLREGMELTLRQLHRIAEANGLSEVAPAPGDSFDPERHQAMSMVEAEGVPPGSVAQLCQKGYVLNERLLRPALVMVARQD
ncbi:MAG: nucleotide exchange factor GrpE [Gammaproteobacteria bacterium]|jgi:molecular chaperone GrpE